MCYAHGLECQNKQHKYSSEVISVSTPIRVFELKNRDNVAIVSSCLPRKCGIATFSENLRNGLKASGNISDVAFIAINKGESHNYPDHVIFEIDQENLEDYYRAATALNSSDVDVVSLQHEFGLFGGSDGNYLRVFLKHVEKPVVTTLHTVPQNPSVGQRKVIQEIFELSEATVVMNALATDILVNMYDVPRTKVNVIPHGVNLIDYQNPRHYKQLLDLENSLIILTFGFLSPNKGIETMLKALPAVTDQCPEVLYIILGMTHPVEKKHNGEVYRDSLKGLVEDLGITNHVLFVDRFVDDEIMDMFVGAADIVVCPYHSQDQITSGVLSTALSRGKAIVSTPYLHAKEVLSKGLGLLVEPKDPEAMAHAVIRLAEHDEERKHFCEQAYAFSRRLGWDSVAKRYGDLFSVFSSKRERFRESG
jgi:glycosyltransferase involved in cell wall biosynthesis